MVQQLLFNAPLNSWCLCRANCVCTVKKKTTQQSLKRTAVSFSSSTFDGAGRNDAPCRSSITSWDNAGFIQVGSRHHHLLQILMDLQQNNKYGLKDKKYYHIFQLKLRHPSLTAHKVTYVLLYYSIRWSSVLLSSHRHIAHVKPLILQLSQPCYGVSEWDIKWCTTVMNFTACLSCKSSMTEASYPNWCQNYSLSMLLTHNSQLQALMVIVVYSYCTLLQACAWLGNSWPNQP